MNKFIKVRGFFLCKRQLDSIAIIFKHKTTYKGFKTLRIYELQKADLI